MGWRFRRSLGIGPFRLNLSKSGFGFSVGVRGFRKGVRPNGHQYTNVSIPGTGASYSTSKKPSSRLGCGFLLFFAFASTALLLGLCS